MGVLARLLGTERPPAPRLQPRRLKDAYQAGQPLSSASSSVQSAFGFGVALSHTGVPVTPSTALQSSAVYACVRCSSEDMAKLSIDVQRALPNGGWKSDREHPIARLLDRPNRWQSWFTFMSYGTTCLQLRGNAYIFVVRDQDGAPTSLVPISPDRCAIRLSPKGWLYYDIWHPAFGDRGNLVVHQDDMLHLRNMTLDGFIGMSPIAAAAEAIGLSLATQQHGANLFRNGTQASGVLKHEGTLGDVGRKNLRESWQAAYGGVDNASKVLVLEEGMTFEKLSMTADEAQFLETRKFQVEEICRIFRVPPHKVMSLDRATFSNIENQNQQYIDDSLVPIARQLEEEARHKLFWEAERGQVRLRIDFDSLLRGDRKTRYDAAHIALGDGWKSRNEVRADEGLPPIPGGDEYRVALNTGVSEAPSSATEPAQ